MHPTDDPEVVEPDRAEADSVEADSVEIAGRLLARLQAFVQDLEPDQRALLAALLAPGVSQAYERPEVAGFGQSWSPAPLPASLIQALQRHPIEFERTHGELTAIDP